MVKQFNSSPVVPGGTAGSVSGSSPHDRGTWAAAVIRDAAVGATTAAGGTLDAAAAAAACKQSHAMNVRGVHTIATDSASDIQCVGHVRSVVTTDTSPGQECFAPSAI